MDPQPAVAGIAQALLEYLAPRQPAMLELLRSWVEIESPTASKAAVDRFGRVVGRQFADLGCRVIAHPDGCYGDHIEAIAEPSPAGIVPARPLDPCTPEGFKAVREIRPGLVVMGHLDTVYPEGTLAATPFRVKDGRAWGPGALDMKGGLVSALFALEALVQLRIAPQRRISFLWVADEEAGSNGSRIITEARARRANAVLVLEPADGPGGALKTARKGTADFTLTARGRAAHAGVDFEQGASAITEVARQVARLAELTDLDRGITVNPGEIRGGTRPNVVAAEASVHLDVRAWSASDLKETAQSIRELEPFDPRVRLEVRGGINRPPMERSAGAERLFARARDGGRELGLALEESATGGASDGNFTAALGVPTLDGLGMVGQGAHSPEESIVIDQIVPRTALLATLLARL